MTDETQQPCVDLVQIFKWVCRDCGSTNYEDPPIVTGDYGEQLYLLPNIVLCDVCLGLHPTRYEEE